MIAKMKSVVRNCFALAAFCLFVGFARAEDMILNVNVKKPVAIVSEKFLSITLDPIVLFNSDSLNDVERSTSMAKALSPAYVRIGGPRSNSYTFERGLYPQETQSDPGYTFTENHWIQVHQWAERSGLDVIACIAPHQADVGNNARSLSSWDPRNALDLISFSDHMGYNTSWQLGYECQTRCEASGAELGRDVQRLRNMLDAFPRYAEHGLIAGPDVVTYKTRLQQQYIQEYFAAATTALSAVTWHPDFAGISLEAEGVSMHHDNLALEKDSFYRIVGRHINKKPLWIAESRPEECKKQFLGALVWTRRLGNSAKLGVQVVMRQPDNSNLFKPTPDYWVSMLHKMLVGREVLDTRITAGNRTHAHFYCQCTKPSERYERGSLTVFGINLTPTKIIASLKGLKLKVVHKYILLPGYDAPNRLFAETILLNNEPLSLIDGKEVPDVQPAVYSTEKGVKLRLPSGGIGFWVLPGLKIKACMGHEDDMTDKSLMKKINKRLEEFEAEEESETDDDSSRELGEPSDSEERKSTTRQAAQKRSPIRRSVRHDREEPGERRARRLDHGVRHDFDRLEKIMLRKDHHSVNLKSGSGRSVLERSSEEETNSSESGAMNKNSKLDSGEVIRAKLEEYKKRLTEHENRQKHYELTSNVHKERIKDEQDESANKGMDTGKVIEALTLITKVENAMKSLEKETDTGDQASGATQTLEPGDFTDVTAGLPSVGRGMERIDDPLLDEVLNTEKAKRTSVPTKIEDQLKALYRLLSEEKQKKEGLPSLRQRRDLEKRSQGDDPLGLRYDSVFVRKRSKSEEARGRLLERINERKQRLRERQELRREKEEQRKDSRSDSSENNFYGFQIREPLKNFPEGDLYLQATLNSTDKKYLDYDYMSDDDEDKLKQQLFNASPRGQSLRDEHEEMWLEEGEGNQMPNEFYENVKLQGYNAKENLKNYGELWEAEALRKDADVQKHPAETTDLTNHEVITERPLSESEDRKAKEKAVQQLYNYYQTDPAEKAYDFEDLRRMQQQPLYQPQAIPAYKHDSSIGINDRYYNEQKYNGYIDPGTYYTDPRTHIQLDQVPYSGTHMPAGQVAYLGTHMPAGQVAYPEAHVQANPVTYPRIRRHINDIEDVLRKEMITQDDNNLKDCQCRVIRGVEQCKGCDTEEKTHLETPGQILQYSNFLDRGNRFKRDVEKDEIVPENEDTVTCVVEEPGGYAPQEEQVELVSSEIAAEDEPTMDLGMCPEDSNEAKETPEYMPVDMEPHLNLENDSDKLLANRLPRKTDSSKKFFLSTGEINAKSTSKKDYEKTKQKISIPTNNYKPSGSTVINDKTETTSEHVADIRSVEESIDQISLANSLKTTPNALQETINQQQLFRVQNSTLTTANITAEPINKKNERITADFKSNITNNSKETSTMEKVESITENQTTVTPILNKPAPVQNITNTTSNASPAKTTVKRANTETPELKNKPKANNNSTKMELVKTRQARLTTRAEALAALKKENESRRAKKMIEASMKIIENENARFAEYQRKRRDQLERLKLKLRAKREKMLQQYRDELLEAINENSDTKERNLRRRDLLEKYENSEDDSRKDDEIANSEKLAFIMRYKPVKYTTDEDDYESTENGRYIPVIEVMRPYHETRRKTGPSKNQLRNYQTDNTNMRSANRYNKETTALNKQFNDDEIYNTSDEQEFGATNKKRSPHSSTDRFTALNSNDKVSGEYILPDQQQLYAEKQQQQRIPEYYSQVMYREEGDIPLQMKYNQQPIPYYDNEETAQHEQTLNYYEISGENVEQPVDVDNYYRQIQENDQQQPRESNFEIHPSNYEEVQQTSSDQNYRKSKRSSLKIIEIDPSIYEEDEPDYNLQELFMRPSSQFSSRSYRNDPYAYNRRYRRAVDSNNNEYLTGPLSFSPGLEKSKIPQKKTGNTATPDSLVRKKRITDNSHIDSNAAFKSNSAINKNVKKVFKADSDAKYKKYPKNSRHRRQIDNSLRIPTHAKNDRFYAFFETLDNAPSKVSTSTSSNHLEYRENGDSPRTRQTRSTTEPKRFHFITSNGIDRSMDPEMNEIWNNIVEMKQDEELLREYDRQKSNKIHNFRETQRNIKKYVQSTTNLPHDVANSTTSKSDATTTQVNIESMLVDAIPKLQTVITGGLEKAQNLTGSLEDFIENFDDQFSEKFESSKETSESPEIVESNDGRVSHNVFRVMVGSVNKFFRLVSNIAKIFHSH